MVFQMETAFAMDLIALALGTLLLVWSAGQPTCQRCAKTIAYFVIVLSISSMLCTSYYSYTYWKAGEFRPRGQHKMMMQDAGGMPPHRQHMMQNQNRPMMPQGQNQGMNPMGQPQQHQMMNPQQQQVPVEPQMDQDGN